MTTQLQNICMSIEFDGLRFLLTFNGVSRKRRLTYSQTARSFRTIGFLLLYIISSTELKSRNKLLNMPDRKNDWTLARPLSFSGGRSDCFEPRRNEFEFKASESTVFVFVSMTPHLLVWANSCSITFLRCYRNETRLSISQQVWNFSSEIYSKYDNVSVVLQPISRYKISPL